MEQVGKVSEARWSQPEQTLCYVTDDTLVLKLRLACHHCNHVAVRSRISQSFIDDLSFSIYI